MHTTGNIIGQTIRLTSGETLGTITDVVTPTPSEATPFEVHGFRVLTGTGTHFLPVTAIREVQRAALITDHPGRLVPTDTLPPHERQEVLQGRIGAPVAARGGNTLGILCGVRLDLNSARVHACEVVPAGAASPVVIPGSHLTCDRRGALTVSPGIAALLSSMHPTESPQEPKTHEPKKEAAPWA